MSKIKLLPENLVFSATNKRVPLQPEYGTVCACISTKDDTGFWNVFVIVDSDIDNLYVAFPRVRFLDGKIELGQDKMNYVDSMADCTCNRFTGDGVIYRCGCGAVSKRDAEYKKTFIAGNNEYVVAKVPRNIYCHVMGLRTIRAEDLNDADVVFRKDWIIKN